MPEIKKINIVKLAILQAMLGGLIGLLLGIIYGFGGFIIDALVTLGWVTTTETPGLSFGTVLAFGAVVGFPIIFAISGFVLGIIEAVLYNICSKWLKWVDFDIKK